MTGLPENEYVSVDRVTLQKITYDGFFKVTVVDDTNIRLTYATTPVTGAAAISGTLKKLDDAPSKEVTKVELAPSTAALKHFNIDQTTTSFGAERNKLALNVYESNTLTRLDNTMLPTIPVRNDFPKNYKNSRVGRVRIRV